MAARMMRQLVEDWTGRRMDTIDAGEEEQAPALPPSFAGGGEEGSCPGGLERVSAAMLSRPAM